MAAESMAAYAPPGFVLFGRAGTLMARPFDADRREFTGDPLPIAENLELGQLGRGQFAVSAEGTLIYTPSGPAGPAIRRLVWLDRTGQSSGSAGAPVRTYGLRLSPDGKRVAFPETSGASGPNTAATDLWIYDTGLDIRTKLTSDPTINHWPVWSPDGTRLVFDSSRDKKLEGHALYEKSANGATPERLLLAPAPGMGLGALDWSRDGQFIVFSIKKAPGRWPYDLWVLPVSGDRRPFPYLTTPFDEPEASLSPNGRWLAYTSNESGSYQVFVQSFPDSSRDRRQISTQGGVHPRWSGDGREIYYLDHDSRITAVAITAGQNLEIGKSTPLFETPLAFPVELTGGPAYPYDVTPDGQWFVVSSPSDAVTAPLVVLLDWAARFRRE
jgi:Tol biopolymer transport system component